MCSKSSSPDRALRVRPLASPTRLGLLALTLVAVLATAPPAPAQGSGGGIGSPGASAQRPGIPLLRDGAAPAEGAVTRQGVAVVVRRQVDA